MPASQPSAMPSSVASPQLAPAASSSMGVQPSVPSSRNAGFADVLASLTMPQPSNAAASQPQLAAPILAAAEVAGGGASPSNVPLSATPRPSTLAPGPATPLTPMSAATQATIAPLSPQPPSTPPPSASSPLGPSPQTIDASAPAATVTAPDAATLAPTEASPAVPASAMGKPASEVHLLRPTADRRALHGAKLAAEAASGASTGIPTAPLPQPPPLPLAALSSSVPPAAPVVSDADPPPISGEMPPVRQAMPTESAAPGALPATGGASVPADAAHHPIAEAGTAPTSGAAPTPQLAMALDAAAPAAVSAPATAHQATAISASPAAPNPASQVVPALLHVVSGESGSRMSLELNPHSLGTVVIAVERPSDGGVKVTLTAARPETLNLLQQDSSQLSHALDRAGVAAEGRSIVFHLAPAASSASSGDSSGQTGAGGSFGAGAGGGGASNLAGQQGGQDPRRSGQSSSYAFNLPAPDTAVPDDAAPHALALVQGFDITA